MGHRLSCAALLCGLLLPVALPCTASAQGVTAASYLGGTGDDHLNGVAIGADGSIYVSGTSTSTAIGGSAGTRLTPGSGFVAKLGMQGSTLQWLTWIDAAGEMKLSAADEPIVISGSHLTKLSSDGSTIVWTGADVGASIDGFDVGASGGIALVAGNTVYRFDADGRTQLFKTPTGRSHAVGVAIDPLSGDVFTSGDTNAGYGTCGGPWRSPFIFRLNGTTGAITTRFYDYKGQQACDQGLAADSFFTRLRFEDDGTFWTTGGADGGNTVLGRAAAALATPNAALDGACFSSACYGWKGANAPRFVGRLKPDVSDFDRATFVVAHFNKRPAACSCDVSQDDGTTARANSAGLDFVFRTSTGDVVGAGSSAWHFPVANAWYPAAAYTPGYPAVVSVLDGDLKTMKMATLLPGTGSTRAAAYRGGRIVVVGGAPDNSAWKPPAGQEDEADAVVKPLPQSNPLQAAFAGGKEDGFVYVACVTNTDECGSTPPTTGGGDPVVVPTHGADAAAPGAGAHGSDAGTSGADAAAEPERDPESSGASGGCACSIPSESTSRWPEPFEALTFVAAVLVWRRRRS